MMTILLALLAISLGVGGLLFTSQATLGVAIVGVGCIVAVWARIVQASDHHSAAMYAEKQRHAEPAKAEPAPNP